MAGALAMQGETRRADELLENVKSGPPYGKPLALATFHMCCSQIDAAADWTERAIEERHPALFFFLRAHAHDLLGNPRWPGLARMLKLP